jgi:hypothetical protein
MSTWRPQPAKEGFPHRAQVIRLHMPGESRKARKGFGRYN